MTTLSAGKPEVITLDGGSVSVVHRMDGQAGVFTAVSDNSIPVYTGRHHVIPKTEGQELPTKNTRLTRNITVAAVPYYETFNENGTTVYIAENTEDE